VAGWMLHRWQLTCGASLISKNIIANPNPLSIWTAKANDILEKVKRAKANLNNSLSV
jgi:hypothetical protein